MEEWLLIGNLMVTAVLFGLIWVVQLVHYPGFIHIHPSSFNSFHAMHTRNISFFVAPMMVVELVLAVLLVFINSSSPGWWGHLFITLAIWTSTFIVQVPLHAKLSSGKDEFLIRKLIRSNWARTILWSLKLPIALYLAI